VGPDWLLLNHQYYNYFDIIFLSPLDMILIFTTHVIVMHCLQYLHMKGTFVFNKYFIQIILGQCFQVLNLLEDACESLLDSIVADNANIST
jgi:hypothetical protein